MSQTGASIYGFTITKFDALKTKLNRGELRPKLANILRKNYKAALMYDGIHAFSRGIERFFTTMDLVAPQVNCNDVEAPYELGRNVYDAIHEVSL